MKVGREVVLGTRSEKHEVTEAVREEWMWESGKDECVHTDPGPEADWGILRRQDLSEWTEQRRANTKNYFLLFYRVRFSLFG